MKKFPWHGTSDPRAYSTQAKYHAIVLTNLCPVEAPQCNEQVFETERHIFPNVFCITRLDARAGWKRIPTSHHQILSRSLQTPPENLNSLESACKYVVSKTSRTCTVNTLQQQFHDDYFQSLLAERRATACRHRRAEISKTSRKEIRRKLRRQRAQRIESVLEEIASLNRLQTFVRMPVQSKSPDCETPKSNAAEFAHFLGYIFASDTGFNSDELRALLEETSANGLPDVEPFTILELQIVVKEMRRNKCADTSGLVAECFIYGNLDLHKCLLDVFNNMLAVGRSDARWSHTVFTMLPKGGNLFSPSNWRPIAVLKITYKIFAKLVYKRLRPTLERHQSKDQVGFRPCTSVEDAFVVLESVCSKSLEWNFPVWFASLDLKHLTALNIHHCLVLYNHKVCLAHI